MLYYEVLHNLVLETTRQSIEVKNLKMRVESLASRLDFSERRVRALEGVVQYRPEAVPGRSATVNRCAQETADHRGRGWLRSPGDAAGTDARAPALRPPPGGTATAGRRRRRRGRRGAAAATRAHAGQPPAASRPVTRTRTRRQTATLQEPRHRFRSRRRSISASDDEDADVDGGADASPDDREPGLTTTEP